MFLQLETWLVHVVEASLEARDYVGASPSAARLFVSEHSALGDELRVFF